MQAATSFPAGRLGREGGREREGRSGQKVPEQVAPLPAEVPPLPARAIPPPAAAGGSASLSRSEGALREMPSRRAFLRRWLGKRIRSADIPHHCRARAKLTPRGDADEQPPRQRGRSGAPPPPGPRHPRDPVSGQGLAPYLPSPLRAAAPLSAPSCRPAAPAGVSEAPSPPCRNFPPSFPASLPLSLSLPRPAGWKEAGSPRAMESLALPTSGGRGGTHRQGGGRSPSAAPGFSGPSAAPHLGEPGKGFSL